MIPPNSNPQGEPAFKMNGMYGRPTSKQIAPNPMFEVKAVLNAKRATDTEIPSPMKSMGITFNPNEISLACRTISDTQKVYMGNSLAQKSLLNATPTSGLSKLGYTNDRMGLFGANFAQPSFGQSTFG